MNKASPVELRKALEVTKSLAKAGILFVAMPSLSKADHAILLEQLEGRLMILEKEANDES